jgi:hypothetical protein
MNRRLAEYEEVAGYLKELWIDNESLIAMIGSISVILPKDLEKELGPLVGQRITILRTDIPTQRYIVRVISDEKMRYPLESESLIQESIADMV